MIGCPGCKATSVREVAVGKRIRAECGGCGRFVSWVRSEAPTGSTAPPEAAEPVATTTVRSVERGDPPVWLYASRRLDLDWVPNEPFYRVEVFTTGLVAKPVAFFRVGPKVVAWLELAGEQLEARHLAGEVGRDQVDAYLEAMNVVWEFAARHLDVDAVRAARSMAAEQRVIDLPEHTGPK